MGRARSARTNLSHASMHTSTSSFAHSVEGVLECPDRFRPCLALPVPERLRALVLAPPCVARELECSDMVRPCLALPVPGRDCVLVLALVIVARKYVPALVSAPLLVSGQRDLVGGNSGAVSSRTWHEVGSSGCILVLRKGQADGKRPN